MPEFKHVQTLRALRPPDLKVPSTLAKPFLLSLKSGQVKIFQRVVKFWTHSPCISQL